MKSRKTILKNAGVLLFASLMFLSSIVVIANTNNEGVYSNNIIADDPVYIFGFNHSALGNASLNVVNNTLVISNIGSSGNDGVQVLLPDDNDIVDFRTEIEFEDPGAQNMSLKMTTEGIIDGESDQVATITSLNFTDGGKNMSLSFDASALQPEFLFVQYFLNGSPVPVLSEEILISDSKPGGPLAEVAMKACAAAAVAVANAANGYWALVFKGEYSVLCNVSVGNLVWAI